MEMVRTPHYVARIHDDLSVETFETGVNAAATRLLVSPSGSWYILGRAGKGNLRLWALDPTREFGVGDVREVAGSEKIEDYVIHTLRPGRFGGEDDGAAVHLVGTTVAPDPQGKERADVEMWHVSFRLEGPEATGNPD